MFSTWLIVCVCLYCNHCRQWMLIVSTPVVCQVVERETGLLGQHFDTMAPHPVVQAIIDLSAGAIGKYNERFHSRHHVQFWIVIIVHCFPKQRSSYVCVWHNSTLWWLLSFSSWLLSRFSLIICTQVHLNICKASVILLWYYDQKLCGGGHTFLFADHLRFLSFSQGELHVSSVDSLWTQPKSRCRPFLPCTEVSSTVSCPPTSKWVFLVSTRAPHQHWWPTLQRTLCSSWATASASRWSASQADCPAMQLWGRPVLSRPNFTLRIHQIFNSLLFIPVFLLVICRKPVLAR